MSWHLVLHYQVLHFSYFIVFGPPVFRPCIFSPPFCRSLILFARPGNDGHQQTDRLLRVCVCTSQASVNLKTQLQIKGKVKGSPYSITERRVPELIPVLCSQPAGDVSHKPRGRQPLFPPDPQLPPQPLRGLLPISLLGEQRHDGCEQFA